MGNKRSEEYVKIQNAQLAELQKTARNLINAAMTGALDERHTVFAGLQFVHQQPGPSGGALFLDCMPAAAVPLLRTLKAGDGVRLRQCITWDFPDESLIIGISGRQIYFYAGWPEHLRQGTLYAEDFAAHPTQKGMFPVGITNGQYPQVVSFYFDDSLAHHGVFGGTGMGKSNALMNMIRYLGGEVPQCGLTGFSNNGYAGTWLIVCDPKWDSDNLPKCHDLACLIGPVARSPQEIRAALTWTMAEVTRRNQIDGAAKRQLPRIIFIMDEVQNATTVDPVIAASLEWLAINARTARIHLCLVAHNPTKAQMGDRNILGEIFGKQVYKCERLSTSANALGLYTADASILGQFQAIAVHPGRSRPVEIFKAFKYDEAAFAKLPRGAPQLAKWPALDAADYLAGGSVTVSPSPTLAAAAIVAALKKPPLGRDKAQSLFAEIGEPVGSNDRTDRLVAWGKQVAKELSSNRLLRVGDS